MVEETRPDHPVVPHRVPPTRRQILTQIVVAVVILGSGIGIGIGGTILALKDRIARFPFPPPGPGGRMETPDANRPVARWKEELSLTDEQAQQIREVLGKSFTAARERWKQIVDAERTEREAFVKSMKGILTPEQFTKWQDEYTQRAQHFDRWRPGGPDRSRDGRGGPDGWKGRGPRGTRGPGFGPDRPPGPGPGGPPGPGPDQPGEPGMDHPPQPGADRPPEPVPVNEG